MLQAHARLSSLFPPHVRLFSFFPPRRFDLFDVSLCSRCLTPSPCSGRLHHSPWYPLSAHTLVFESLLSKVKNPPDVLFFKTCPFNHPFSHDIDYSFSQICPSFVRNTFSCQKASGCMKTPISRTESPFAMTSQFLLCAWRNSHCRGTIGC